MGFLLFFMVVVVGIALVVAIFFILTLQGTLKAITPENRKMEPGMTWLLLIPLFNIVWMFIVVRRISDSIHAEFTSRGHSVDEQPTYKIGLMYCILLCLGTIFQYTISSAFGGVLSLVSTVCWILYWIKVAEYKRRIEQLPPANMGDSIIFNNQTF